MLTILRGISVEVDGVVVDFSRFQEVALGNPDALSWGEFLAFVREFARRTSQYESSKDLAGYVRVAPVLRNLRLDLQKNDMPVSKHIESLFLSTAGRELQVSLLLQRKPLKHALDSTASLLSRYPKDTLANLLKA